MVWLSPDSGISLRQVSKGCTWFVQLIYDILDPEIPVALVETGLKVAAGVDILETAEN